MSIGRILRIAAAIALLIGGLVHLDLYFNLGYRSIPDIGRSFMLNAIASAVVAAAVAARTEWFVRLAGIGVAGGTIIAFILSRRDGGLFNFQEVGFEPSPQAGLALFVEITAIVLIGLTFIPALAVDDRSLGIPLAGVCAAVAAVVTVGFGVSAASDDGSSTAASAETAAAPTESTVTGESTTTVASGAAPAGGDAVSIKDFSFQAPTLAVAAGTTVTWTNDDGVGHSVNAKDDSFNSERLSQGDTFQFAFETAGEFAYVCDIHPYMAATITVSG